MPITPWFKGDTMPIWKISLIPDTGYFDVSTLSPTNFSLLIKNTDAMPATETAGTGIFSNVTAAVTNGNVIVSHAYVEYLASSADVANLGNFVLFVIVTFAGGATETFSVGPWQVVTK
jgi:hypothetical protein